MKNYKYRPDFHLSCDVDNGYPGDPNGCFYVDGVYHFMMLYKNSQTNGYHWAHFTTKDLINWTRLEDALTTFNGDEGCYSGGAFVDEDKRAYLTFWRLFEKKLKVMFR